MSGIQQSSNQVLAFARTTCALWHRGLMKGAGVAGVSIRLLLGNFAEGYVLCSPDVWRCVSLLDLARASKDDGETYVAMKSVSKVSCGCYRSTGCASDT
jgi:hypothetical protein